MREITRNLIFAFIMASVSLLASAADNASEIQTLKDAKALLDAQAARDASEAAAIKAATDLAKAKAAAANAANDIQKSQAAADAKALLDAQAAKDASEAAAIKAGSDLAKAKAMAGDVANDIQKGQYDAAAALTKSQIGAQTASLDALKTTFGAAPTVGSDGNISITDSTTGVLLEIKAGSLQTTWLLAEKLCKNLAAAQIKDAFIAPPDLDAKIQSARMVLREFTALLAKVRLKENRDLVNLGGAQAEVAPAAVLGAVSLLQYGAGALQTIARLTRSDYAVGLSTDATRVAWLEYFMVARCPEQVPRAQLEAAVRNQSLDTVLSQLNELLEFHNNAVSTKSSVQKQIDLLSARIVALKAEKQDTSAFENQLAEQNKIMATLIPLDVWVPRIQTLIASVSTAPSTFLDALTWNAFGDENHALKISAKPRLTVVLTTQDGQVTKTFWLTGKTVYGRSAGELAYRVLNPDGKVVTAGYLTSITSMGEIDFKAKNTSIIYNDQRLP